MKVSLRIGLSAVFFAALFGAACERQTSPSQPQSESLNGPMADELPLSSGGRATLNVQIAGGVSLWGAFFLQRDVGLTGELDDIPVRQRMSRAGALRPACISAG